MGSSCVDLSLAATSCFRTHRYLGFLHSVLRSRGRTLYRVAAYTFNAKPPFAIDAISPPFEFGALTYPIGVLATKRHIYLSCVLPLARARATPTAIFACVAPALFSVKNHPPCIPCATRKWFGLRYGADDVDWAIAKMDRQALLASLVPVRTEPMPSEIATMTSTAPLPRRLHFFQGIPKDVRDTLAACQAGQQVSRGSGSSQACTDLLGAT